MRQVEVSRTIVLDDPRRARSFFEALVADNIGVGRPEEIRPRSFPPSEAQNRAANPDPACSAPAPKSRWTSPTSTAASSNTSRKGEPFVSRPSSTNRKISASLPASSTYPRVIDRARDVNARLLMIERAGQGCAIGSALFERIHQPFNLRANEPQFPSQSRSRRGLTRSAAAVRPDL